MPDAAMTGRAPSGKADIIESWPVSVELTIRSGRCTVRPSTSTRVPGISLGGHLNVAAMCVCPARVSACG